MARAGEPVDSDGSIEWVKLHVGETDQTYHWNRRTRETTWRAPEGVKVVWMGGTSEWCGTSSRSLVTLRMLFLRCLLGDSLQSEGLGISSPLLGCHQVRCAHRTPVWTSLWLWSSSLCSSTRTWWCLSFRSSTECSNFQLCYRGVYAQCKLCKSWRFHRAVLRRCLRAYCCALTGAGDGPDSAENREVSARVLGQGCLTRCDARQGVVQTVQKTVKFPKVCELVGPCAQVHGQG